MSHLDPKVKGSIQVGRGDTFGDLPVGADGNLLQADSAEASGVKWVSPGSIPGVGSGLAGLWLYGDGSDGSLTLVGPTTLAAGDSVKNYDSLTLAGFTLTFSTSDDYMVIYVKDTLTGGGGTLSALSRGNALGSGNPGGLGGSAGGTSGAGGNGGDGSGSVYVFARNIGGVTIDASGGDGVDGTNGSLFGAGAGTSGAMGALNIQISFQSTLFPPLGAGAQIGTATGGGGILGSVAASTIDQLRRTYKDLLRLILLSGISTYTSGSPADERDFFSAPGAGGGGGNAAAGVTTVDGGGGAGGLMGVTGAAGGAGGSAAALATGAGDKASGGGGGSGAGGSLVCLICDTATAAVSVLADGGDGGDGGDGAAAGAGVAIGGGGAGGGGGGIAAAIVAVGSGFITVSAVGGALGVGGTSAGSGTPGGSGIAGDAGYSTLLVKA